MTAEPTALAITRSLHAGEHAKVHALLCPALASQVTEQDLSAAWGAVRTQAGVLSALGTPRVDGNTAAVPLVFSRGSALELYVETDQADLATMLVIRPAQSDFTWFPPRYDERTYDAIATSVGKRGPIGASLRVPKKSNANVAVVLLSGGGPTDRDGTDHGVKPLRDLAVGLASKGLVVLSFDKRSFFEPMSVPATAGLDEELDDAQSAVEALGAHPSAKGKRIVVIGHDLGGTLAPALAERVPAVAGLVLLAAPTRPYDEVVADRLRGLEALGAAAHAEATRQMEIDPVRLGALAQLRSGSRDCGPLPLGLSPQTWTDLDALAPVARVERLGLPTLVVHGARDAQVFEADRQAWEALDRRAAHVKLVTAKGCDHRLVEGKGPAVPEAYAVKEHLAASVLKDVRAFLDDKRFAR